MNKKSDYEAIKELMDKAMLSRRPLSAFEEALPSVRAYPSVDTAWISGPGFFVKFRQGGTVSWLITENPKH